MFIYGGIDDKNKLLEDGMAFNTETDKWADIFTEGETPGKLAYHTSNAVYPDCFTGHAAFTIYQFPKYYQKRETILEIGIYLFGGLDGDGEMSN
jgi:hypothetical protein